jgi:hypothetical protein
MHVFYLYLTTKDLSRLPQKDKRLDQHKIKVNCNKISVSYFLLKEENSKGFYCDNKAIVTFIAVSIVGFCSFAASRDINI